MTTMQTALMPVLAQFAMAYGCMLVIPGPNMLVVLRSCDGVSALRPVMAAAGVACGAMLASVVAASSAAVLPTGPLFRSCSGVLVAAILLRAALHSVRGRGSERNTLESRVDGSLTPFLLGLGASVLNPVSVPYFASFFVSHACSHLAAALTCGLVFTMAGTWFSLLGWVSTRLGRIPVPPACQAAANAVVVATLVALAARHLWAALS